MRLFRKLFAEKILRYYEGTEGGIRLIKSLPLVKKHIKEDAFGEKSKARDGSRNYIAANYAVMGVYKKIIVCMAVYVYSIYDYGTFLPVD